MNNIKKLKRMGYFSADELKMLERGRELWYSKIVETSKKLIKELGWNQGDLFYHMIPSCQYVLIVYYDGTFLCSIPPLDSMKEMQKIIGHFLNLKKRYYSAYEQGDYSDIIHLIENKYREIVYNIFCNNMSDKQMYKETLKLKSY